MITRRKIIRSTALTAMLSLFVLIGCTPAEEEEAITDAQTALTDLSADRSLTEQFVRDLKANCDSESPACAQAMSSYEDARDTYNRYLDDVENGNVPQGERSLHHSSPRDVENAATDFLSDATRALKPSVNTRQVAFQRAVIIPNNLQYSLSKLPKKARRNIVEQFDDQVRWRSWEQL